MQAMIGERVKKVKGLIMKEGLDAVLVSSYYNILYLTNLSFFIPIEREAFLVITKKNSYILTYQMYEEAVRKNLKGFKIIIISRENSFKKVLYEIYKEENIRKIGIEEHDLSVWEFKRIKKSNVRFLPVDLLKIRRIKAEAEILEISKACNLGDRAFEYIIDKLVSGITEIEVSNLLSEFIRKKADISFEPIVAFGANSSSPHHKPNGQKLKVGDFILLDFGVKINNYCSDMTRTIFFRKVSKEQKQIYEAVLRSQKASVEFIKNAKNIKGEEVDKISRAVIKEEGFPDYPHTLGHGIGLEVHEHRFLAPNSQESIEDGMVFSIEPGIYIPNFGGVRIEDLFLYEKGVLRQLTRSVRGLTVV
jgi:Xaa-Pro aminopeptidase